MQNFGLFGNCHFSMKIFSIFEKNIRETADFLDLLDFPLHFLYEYKGNQANRGKSRKSAVLEGNSKLKSTYLSEFLTDFKNFNIFEQEIMPSRAWDAVTIICS